MKLLAYILSGNTLGIDIETWEVDDLEGNEPFITIEDVDSTPTGYTNISTILGWGLFGENSGMKYNLIRDEIQKLLPTPISGLTADEQTIVEYFQLNKYYNIYDFMDYRTHYHFAQDDVNVMVPPLNIDYDILGLKKKRYFDKGELYKVEYYGHYNETAQTYSDLCVREERIYYRVNRFVSRREMDIIWIYTDGTDGEKKHTTKHYTLNEGIQAGEIRRSNVISNLKITVVGLIMMSSGVTSVESQAMGRPFINTYSSEISKYIQGFEDDLRNSIAIDNIYSWLDLEIPNTGGITIRQYLISELTIDYEKNNIDVV